MEKFSRAGLWAVLAVSAGLVVLAVWTKGEWGAVLPAAVSLAVAVVSHRILLALACGGLCGAILAAGGNIFAGAVDWVVRDALGSLTGSGWKVTVVVVTLLMGGFAALLERGGAIESLFRKTGAAKGSARAAQGGAFLAGIVCFFDGLANALLVGRVMRGAFDRCGLARERLAYIADSTASPVACIGVASTWIAYQLAMIAEGAGSAGVEVAPFALYLAAWPAIFYSWGALMCVALFVFTDWTIGPMRRVQAEGVVVSGAGDGEDRAVGLWRVLVPIAVLMFALIGGLYLDGARALLEKKVSGFSFAEAVGAADSGRILLLGTLAGCAAAFVFFPRGGAHGAGEVFLSGAQGMLYPVAILVLAWALGSTLEQLGTARVVAGLLQGNFPLFLYPALVFVVACATAFGTGTSWGTMGVLMPVALPAAITLAGTENILASPLVVGAVAAVMGGSVFGDHCSPVSDTTIVSATASGCDTWSHVATQIPYAAVAAVVSLAFGYVPLGMGFPAWMCLAAVLGALLVLRFAVFRNREE